MKKRLSDINGFDTDNFLLEVQKGDIPGTSVIWRSGSRNTADTTLSDVWSSGGTYNYLSTAVPLYLWSTNIGDTQSIRIEGLNALYEYQAETLVLTGTTAVTSTKTWLRVNDLHNNGTTDVAGTVYASRVSGSITIANLLASILGADNHSMMAMYSVPKGYSGHLFQGAVAVGKGKDATFTLRARRSGGVFVNAETVSTYQQSLDLSRPFLFLPEMTDVKVSSTLDLAALVQASFGILLVSNLVYPEQGPIYPSY